MTRCIKQQAKGAVLSARSIGPGGLGESALAEMAFGNSLGVSLERTWTREDLFSLSVRQHNS